MNVVENFSKALSSLCHKLNFFPIILMGEKDITLDGNVYCNFSYITVREKVPFNGYIKKKIPVYITGYNRIVKDEEGEIVEVDPIDCEKHTSIVVAIRSMVLLYFITQRLESTLYDIEMEIERHRKLN